MATELAKFEIALVPSAIALLEAVPAPDPIALDVVYLAVDEFPIEIVD